MLKSFHKLLWMAKETGILMLVAVSKVYFPDE